MLVGNSLSAAYNIPPEAGWVALIEKRAKTEYPSLIIVNASIPGDTTANGIQRLPSLLQQHHPTIVILELGGNDGLRGLPLRTIEKNLSTLIEQIQASHAQVLLIGIQLPPNYGADYTQAFAAIYPRLSKRYALPLVPFLLAGIPLTQQMLFEDGIHPRAIAQSLIMENVWPQLAALLEGR